MTIVYDYATARFIRNSEGELYQVTRRDNLPRTVTHNTRFIDTQDYGAIDLAYVYMENGLAEEEGRELIELDKE